MKMKNPEIEIIRFHNEDIITSSGNVPGLTKIAGNELLFTNFAFLTSEAKEQFPEHIFGATPWHTILGLFMVTNGGFPEEYHNTWYDFVKDTMYAWYNTSDSSWYTQQKTVESYGGSYIVDNSGNTRSQ